MPREGPGTNHRDDPGPRHGGRTGRFGVEPTHPGAEVGGKSAPERQIPDALTRGVDQGRDRHVEAFLEMLVAERGAARNTLLAYDRDLNDFSEFAAGSGEGIARASPDTLRKYMAGLGAQGLKPRSAARRLSALRQFHRFLLREGIRTDDPTRLLDAPKLPAPLPKYLSETEVDALLAATDQLAGRPGLVARAALEILYATGLRVSELLALPRTALAGEAQILLVRGKGGRERIVPLSDAAK